MPDTSHTISSAPPLFNKKKQHITWKSQKYIQKVQTGFILLRSGTSAWHEYGNELPKFQKMWGEFD